MESSELDLFKGLEESMADIYKPVNVAELQKAALGLAERYEAEKNKELPPEMVHGIVQSGTEDIREKFFLTDTDDIKIKVPSDTLKGTINDPNLNVLPPILTVEGRVWFTGLGYMPDTEKEDEAPAEDKPIDLALFIRGVAVIAGESCQVDVIAPVASIKELGALERIESVDLA